METEDRLFLSLSGRGAELWNAPEPIFGANVEGAFPDSTDDLKEAARCLALERGTAAIFHLMRATEGAVKVLGAKLGATVLNANGEALPWGVLVSNIKPKIDALAKGQDQDAWYAVHALLHSVNRAFRTKTAHPASGLYTEEQARDAFAATKAFLQEMAERVV